MSEAEFQTSHVLLGESHRKAIDSLPKKDGDLSFVCEGKDATFRGILGRGGSKSVFEVTIGDESFALALPNPTDNNEIMKNKWGKALTEPDKTKKLRNMGLLVNPICEVVELTIKGVPFTGIKMARYEDLPFHVMDGKAPYILSIIRDVLPKDINLSSFETFFTHISCDVVTMVKNGVIVDGFDSVNVCIDRGALRLFLSDLGDMKINDLQDPGEVELYVRSVVTNALGAFVSKLSEEDQQKMEQIKLTDALNQQLKEGVVARVCDEVLQSLKR